MNTASTILIIVAILVAMVLGVVLAVTISLYFASRQIKNRIDLLDEHLVFLINTIEDLDESSTNELNALHKSLDEQQKVHKSIAQSSRIFNLVFKKPAVIVGASKTTVSNRKLSKKKINSK